VLIFLTLPSVRGLRGRAHHRASFSDQPYFYCISGGLCKPWKGGEIEKCKREEGIKERGLRKGRNRRTAALRKILLIK
jgi:hypothetical protein